MPDSIAHSNRMLQRSVWQYANGERNFRLQDLKSLSFIQANLSGADFTGTSLSGADLSNSDLSNVNLNWTIVKGANLQGAKMPDDRMHNNYLESANHLGG